MSGDVAYPCDAIESKAAPCGGQYDGKDLDGNFCHESNQRSINIPASEAIWTETVSL